MDNFMDKLAKRFNAGEIIKANSQAEARDMKRMQERTAEYERMMQEMRRLNLKNVELTEQVQQLIQCGIEQIEGYGSGEALLGNKIDETGTSLKAETAAMQEAIKENVDFVRADIESVKTDMASVKEEIAPVKNYMQTLKYDVDSVKESTDFVKDGMDVVRESIDSVKDSTDLVKDSVDAVRGEMDYVKGDMASVKDGMDIVRESMESVKDNTDLVKDGVDFIRDEMDSVKGGLDFIRGNMDSVKDSTDLVKDSVDFIRDGVDSIKDNTEALKGSISDAAYKTDDGFYRMSGRLDEMERNINEEMQQNHQAVFIALRDLEDKAGSDSEMSESVRTMKELLVGLRISSEEGQKHLEEHVHKENIRVYRNVQAVVTEEGSRRARELGERMDRLENEVRKSGGLKPLVIITLLLALASLGMQVAQILQLF